MITKETACSIWCAYEEIAKGEELLKKLEEAAREARKVDLLDVPPLLAAIIIRAHIAEKKTVDLLDVHPRLAASIIRAHIAEKKTVLANLQECARVELDEANNQPAAK